MGRLLASVLCILWWAVVPSHAQQVLFPGGSSAAPALSFSGDDKTGLFLIGPSELGIGTGGKQRIRLNSQGTLVLEIDQVDGGRLEIQKTDEPLNYSGTVSGLVVQTKDDVNRGQGVFANGMLSYCLVTGDGQISANSSQTVWHCNRSSVVKHGDGSAALYGGNGTLQAGTYNELGGLSLLLTNAGSSNGIVTGAEILVRDGVSDTDHRDTQLHVMTPRIARFADGSKSVVFIYPSAEGDYPADAIMKLNPNGLAKAKVGIDLRAWQFTDGATLISPLDAALAWINTAGTRINAIRMDTLNNLVLKPGGANADIILQDGNSATRLRVDSSGIYLDADGTGIKKLSIGPADSAGTGYRMLRLAN